MEFLKPVIEKLGIDADTLSKLEKGEVTADDFVSGFIKNLEKPIVERIKTQVETESKSELQRGAYARAEKLLSETFGLDLSKYENVDNQKRLSTIISDLKTLEDQTIEKLKKEYSSADAQKLQQLTAQLEQANNALTDKEKAIEATRLEGKSELDNYIKNQKITKLRDTLIEGVQNPRLEPKIMRAVIDAEMSELGYDLEHDAEGNIWINKDGKRVQNPKKPTENLKYEMVFAEIAEKNGFTKQSNGGTNHPAITIKDGEIDSIAAKRLEHLRKQGHL